MLNSRPASSWSPPPPPPAAAPAAAPATPPPATAVTPAAASLAYVCSSLPSTAPNICTQMGRQSSAQFSTSTVMDSNTCVCSSTPPSSPLSARSLEANSPVHSGPNLALSTPVGCSEAPNSSARWYTAVAMRSATAMSSVSPACMHSSSGACAAAGIAAAWYCAITPRHQAEESRTIACSAGATASCMTVPSAWSMYFCFATSSCVASSFSTQPNAMTAASRLRHSAGPAAPMLAETKGMTCGSTSGPQQEVTLVSATAAAWDTYQSSSVWSSSCLSSTSQSRPTRWLRAPCYHPQTTSRGKTKRVEE